MLFLSLQSLIWSEISMSTEGHQIRVGGLDVDVVRKPIKNLHLGVYPPNGRVRVAAPVGVSDEAVRLFTPRLRVKSLDELNVWLLDKCIAYAKAHKHPEQTDQTVWQMFEAERPHLVGYAGPFDGFHSVPAHSTIVLEPMANKVSYVQNLHGAVRQ